MLAWKKLLRAWLLKQNWFSRVNGVAYVCVCVYFDYSEFGWSAVGSRDCAAEPRISAKENA